MQTTTKELNNRFGNCKCQTMICMCGEVAKVREQFEVFNEKGNEFLRISRGELNRHVSRLSRVENRTLQVTVSNVVFRQIKSARAEA